MTTQLSKKEHVAKIVDDNLTSTRKDLIAIIVKDVGMTDAGASTYLYNEMKARGTSTAKVTKPIDPVVAAVIKDEAAKAEAIVAPTVNSVEEVVAREETVKVIAAKPAKKVVVKTKTAPTTAKGDPLDTRAPGNVAGSKAREEINQMLSEIDLNEIPAFLKK